MRGYMKMRHSKSIGWVALIVMALLAGSFQPAHAQAEEPYLPGMQPPANLTTESGDLATDADSTVLNFPSLKAVLIVGPMGPADYLTGQLNTSRATAATLRSYGMQVVELYTPNATWQQVKQEAANAQFILYRGHGIRWSADETNVGGFALDDGLISPETIRREMKLGRNAIFMFFACYSAGSEGDPSREPVSEATARGRVDSYARAVLDIGAAGYYANWRGTAFQDIIRSLLQGQTLLQAYQSNQVSKTTLNSVNPSHSDLDLRIGYDVFSATSAYYDNAFTGSANATLSTLFNKLEAPAQITDVIPKGSGIVEYTVPVNSSLNLAIPWTATITTGAGNWLPVTQWSGTTGESLRLQVDTTLIPENTRQNALLHIHTDDPNVANPDLDVPIEIIVACYRYKVYMPLVLR